MPHRLSSHFFNIFSCEEDPNLKVMLKLVKVRSGVKEICSRDNEKKRDRDRVKERKRERGERKR